MNARAAQAYKSTHASSAVLSASPHKQVALLYTKLRQSLQRGIACIESKELIGKIEAINKAHDILSELHATLNHSEGGEVSASLAQLYEYCLRRLVTANRTNDAGILREIDTLITKIEGAWNSIGESVAA